ncbi:MAG: hypothetical protein IJU69_07350 [Bacteroidales bacterium]|nr:hypothetical protein [Bacteroidales bacterium]
MDRILRKITGYLKYSILLAQVLIISCTNDPNYDFDKPVNTDISLFGEGISVPIGSSSEITIGDAIDFSKTPVIIRDEKGDYRISCRTEIPSRETICIKKIDVSALEFRPKTWLYYEFPPEVVGKEVPEGFSRTEPIHDISDTTLVINLPDEIEDLRSVELEAELDVHLQLTNDSLRLNKGLRLIFNDNIEVEPNADFLDSFGPGEARTNRDLEVGSTIDFSAIIKKIHVRPEDIVVEDGQRKAKMEICLTVIGEAYMDNTYFSVFPPYIILETSSNTQQSEIKSAEVKLNYRMDAGDFGFEVAPLPDAVVSADISLSDPCILLEIENSSPVAMLLEGRIVSSFKGIPSMSVPVSEIPVKAKGETPIYICKASHEVPEGAIKVVSGELSDIFRKWPDKISVEGLSVKADTPDFIFLELGKEESMACNVELFSPLSLNEGSEIEFEQRITGLGITFGKTFELAEISLDFTAASSLPFETSLSAYALDSNGERIEDIAITAEGSIPAAAPGEISKAPVKIRLMPQKAIDAIDGIAIDIKAVAGKEAESTALNAGQSFSLENIVLSLPQGVTLRSTKEKNK